MCAKAKSNKSTVNITSEGRITFAKSKAIIDYPDFLDIQIESFKQFLQIETTPDNRSSEGLNKVFQENFPITDSRENFKLEFLDYFVDPPRYSIEECQERGLTYSVPLKARLRLSCNDPENEDFQTVEEEVFLGNIPYMTPKGTFIINGAERVIVSQLHRSPGVFFGSTKHPNNKKLFSARVIPFKGSWIEFSTDINDVMYAYIDRKKKFPVTTLLRAIGFSTDKDILTLFGLAEEIKNNKKDLKKAAGRKLAARVLRTWMEDFVDEDTGEVISIQRDEVIFERDHILEEADIETILEQTDIESIIIVPEKANINEYQIIFNTLQKDSANSEKQAIELIYRQLRNTDAPDDETAKGIIDRLFFSEKRYDLGEVGRYRINKKLSDYGIDPNGSSLVLTREDIVAIIRHLIDLINSKYIVDDIDHLSNRRVRTVGEQLYAQFSTGLSRMGRTIRERMNIRDNEVFKPQDLINARTLSSVINSFFGTSQLSQFLDQTNPLAELTNKRRMSALGPGGLSRERAGFEVRDVHYTHYGRLCPIETPEGPNIGLISSLCVYAKVNSMGFIETPYRVVDDGKATETVVYLSAEEEDGQKICTANTPVEEDGTFSSDLVKVRHEGDFPITEPQEVKYMDIGTNQIVGIAASLIPFLEHDDANRALMGSNMQRQAVPLLRPESPIVGTGLEGKVAVDSRAVMLAEGDGEVIYVDANKIVIRYHRNTLEELVSFDGPEKEYNLTKFKRTNQDTAINIVPIVRKGDIVKKKQPITEGFCTQKGELALGKNLLVAFMPWQGYNFEDAIVISERVVAEDVFTSVHIEEFEVQVRDTKRGEEELTSEIPNVSEDATKNLDDNGMIRIGAEVKEGDILIGKITPKGETDPTPEEKLLRAIFGDKAGDVKDASLKAPPGLLGVVIDKKLFTRQRKEVSSRKEDKIQLAKLETQHFKNQKALDNTMFEKLCTLLEVDNPNSKIKAKSVKNKFGEVKVQSGTKFTAKILQSIRDENKYIEMVSRDWTNDEAVNDAIKKLFNNYVLRYNELEGKHKREKHYISVGDELPQGIVQLAKVYIAKKRKLRVGDKMAGRHGNKGVVAKIVRPEDMPFLADGTPVDIVLNPLGVPSRMNLGQIYETLLGWAGKKLGVKFATPVFDGAKYEDLQEYLEKADLPADGRVQLYNGQTGEPFDQKTTVGIIYMLKLGHMVDDKMHARSIGPYSLITQQPLGGKAQFGGQRFGEMEVWALEAFGAAHILQEIITYKSDDVVGRAKVYEAIVKGDNIPEPNIPESFNVLLHELRGLGLEITLD